MVQTSDNLCPLCGKVRVVVKTYKKKIGNSVITYTEKSCPDKTCQKKLEGQLHKEEDKRRKIKEDQVLREEERRKNIKDKKKNS